MSGIYIPGVEKSKTCAFCRFCDGLADTQLGACAFCVVDGKAREADITPKDCPLIPVPEHGRLIDADELPFVESENGRQDDYVFRYDINEMPTIIPADKEGEG